MSDSIIIANIDSAIAEKGSVEPGNVPKQRELTLSCVKCGAAKIAHSRAKGLDKLYMRFVPSSPYRCMRCYHRFWKSEGLFDSSPRVWTWSILLLTLVGVFGMAVLSDDSPAQARAHELSDEQSTLSETSLKSLLPNQAVSDTPDDPLRAAARQAALEDQQLLASMQLPVSKTRSVDEPTRTVSVKPDRTELESHARREISQLVERWRAAWAAGVSDVYLNYYSDEFVPANGMSLKRWQRQRQKRVTLAKKIELTLDKFDVSFDNDVNRSVIGFDQHYRSGTYSERSRKQLVLQKESQSWRIISEVEVP